LVDIKKQQGIRFMKFLFTILHLLIYELPSWKTTIS